MVVAGAVSCWTRACSICTRTRSSSGLMPWLLRCGEHDRGGGLAVFGVLRKRGSGSPGSLVEELLNVGDRHRLGIAHRRVVEDRLRSNGRSVTLEAVPCALAVAGAVQAARGHPGRASRQRFRGDRDSVRPSMAPIELLHVCQLVAVENSVLGRRQSPRAQDGVADRWERAKIQRQTTSSAGEASPRAADARAVCGHVAFARRRAADDAAEGQGRAARASRPPRRRRARA